MSDEKKNTIHNNEQRAKTPDNTISNEMRGTP
nr:MAG TPA: hypothetical protein [Caudoviricetes sp.]